MIDSTDKSHPPDPGHDDKPAVVLQITDTHLFACADTTHRGVNTQASLDAVLAHARADSRWPPDAVIVTGDIVHDESRTGYRRFRRTLESLALPAFCVPGNHDDPALLEECLAASPIQVCGETGLGTWRVILLSTFGEGAVGGALGPGELTRMESALEKHPGNPTLICMHHPPVAMGSAWLDSPRLEDAEAFLQLVGRHPQVSAVLWGHVHQASDRTMGGVRYMSTPSTCVQFRPDRDVCAVDDLPPGLRWIALEPGGGIATEVSWAEFAAPPPARSR